MRKMIGKYAVTSSGDTDRYYVTEPGADNDLFDKMQFSRSYLEDETWLYEYEKGEISEEMHDRALAALAAVTGTPYHIQWALDCQEMEIDQFKRDLKEEQGNKHLEAIAAQMGKQAAEYVNNEAAAMFQDGMIGPAEECSEHIWYVTANGATQCSRCGYVDKSEPDRCKYAGQVPTGIWRTVETRPPGICEMERQYWDRHALELQIEAQRSAQQEFKRTAQEYPLCPCGGKVILYLAHSRDDGKRSHYELVAQCEKCSNE